MYIISYNIKKYRYLYQMINQPFMLPYFYIFKVVIPYKIQTAKCSMYIKKIFVQKMIMTTA